MAAAPPSLPLALLSLRCGTLAHLPLDARMANRSEQGRLLVDANLRRVIAAAEHGELLSLLLKRALVGTVETRHHPFLAGSEDEDTDDR